VAPDGASLITSVGLNQSTVWVRDEKGERQISSEGYAEFPKFSRDGKKLYYIAYRHGVSGQSPNGEIWVADLESGRRERLVPDILVSDYDVSPDAPELFFPRLTAKTGHVCGWLRSTSGFPSEVRFGSERGPTPLGFRRLHLLSRGRGHVELLVSHAAGR